ncbi:hypothetical protein GBAR_LOCUS17855 [Geodia barretti]|uniref:Uncharacterized protein n=1 Tax=Geodia barretti TaxID=519541 RepID=A0AA35WYK6_GEOBA|nr:hypothetical protein GBAR_LOCUS17855 [Geodia barretti]
MTSSETTSHSQIALGKYIVPIIGHSMYTTLKNSLNCVSYVLYLCRAMLVEETHGDNFRHCDLCGNFVAVISLLFFFLVCYVVC